MSEHESSANQKVPKSSGALKSTIGSEASGLANDNNAVQKSANGSPMRPANIQRQLSKLHGAPAQKLVMRAASIHGNKATTEIIHRSMETKNKPVGTPQVQRTASQLVQRDFLGSGNFGFSNIAAPASLNLNKAPVNKDFSAISTPSGGNFGNNPNKDFSAISTPGGSNFGNNIPNVSSNFQSPAAFTDPYADFKFGGFTVAKIRALSDKDFNALQQVAGGRIPSDIRNTPDKPTANKDFSGIANKPIDSGLNASPALGDKSNTPKDFTAIPQFMPTDQLPPLPAGTQGVTVIKGVPEVGQVIGPNGQPQYLIIVSPQGHNGNPRGTLLTLDGSQVVPGSGSGSSPAVASAVGNPLVTPTGAGQIAPVTIPGYDRGTLLSQLPTNASIKLVNVPTGASPGVEPMVNVANGLPANAVGVVVGQGGKEKGYVTLKEVDGIPAGTVFSIKFPQSRIGSIQPGSTDNPFKTPAVPTTASQDGATPKPLGADAATSISTPVAPVGSSGGGVVEIGGLSFDLTQIVSLTSVAGPPGTVTPVTKQPAFQGCQVLVDGSRATWQDFENDVSESGISAAAIQNYIKNIPGGIITLLGGEGWAGMNWFSKVGDHLKANSGLSLVQRIKLSEVPAVLYDVFRAVQTESALGGSAAVPAHTAAAVASGTVLGVNADIAIKYSFARQAERYYNATSDACNKAYPGYFPR